MPLIVPAKKNGRASDAATERGGGGGRGGIVAGGKERPSLRGGAATAEESAAKAPLKARHAASSRGVKHDAQNAVPHSLDAGQGDASTSGSMFVKTVNFGSTGITGSLIFSTGLAPTDHLSAGTPNAGTTAKTRGALHNALPPYTHTPRQPGDSMVRESVYIHRLDDSGAKHDARKPIRHSSDVNGQWTGYHRHVGVGRRIEVSARPSNEGYPNIRFCSPEYAARNTGCTNGFIVVKTVNAGASGVSGGLVFSTGTIAQKAQVKEVKEKTKNAQLAQLAQLAAAQTDAKAARAEVEATKAKV